MLDINPWFEFVKNNIMEKSELKELNMEHFSHTCVYVMCYQLSKMIRQTLYNYLSNCNVPDKTIPILDMKNEYLFSSMLITDVKKNYATIVEYKEGKPMFGKPDYKGLPITKSSSNRVASERFKEILENDILNNIDNVSVIDIIVKLNEFQNQIKNSLQNGENTFLKPVRIKDIQAYDDPLKVSGLRGALIWNELYKDNEIILPDSFYLIKLKTHKRSDLDLIQDEEMRNKIDELIFDNPEERIRTKGFYVFAIPRDTLIPDWVKPCIDVDLMVEDIMRSFMGVVRALGISTIFTSAQNNQISSFVTL